MKHYYLINGTVKVSDSKMPEKQDYISNKIIDYFGAEQSFNHLAYKNDYDNWLSSLQPCEIDESELDKIDSYFYEKWYQNNGGFDSHKQMLESNPIDITDIVKEEPINCCNQRDVNGECMFPNCEVKTKIYFKQPTEKQVESDLPHGKPLEYWKKNAEEDYAKVPISVLRYITILEEEIFKNDNMENTNLSEAREKIDLLTIEIEVHEKHLNETLAKLTVLEAKIEVLKERKKSLLNYLNTDNN